MDKNNCEKNYLQKLRHSTAHLFAHAILELHPDTLITIGPDTQDGFFYDILPSKNLKEVDIVIIENKMHEIAKRDLKIVHTMMKKDDAKKLFSHNKFKLELIDSIDDEMVGIATQGDFVDLCKGGHIESTGKLEHFKLASISGSYWRADRDGIALQRFTGIAFETAKDLQDYETLKEELQKYDHRKIGKQLDLFSIHDEGVGFPFYHPKGKTILNQLIFYMRSLLQKGNYSEIETPFMLSDELWRQSGHYQFYKNNMYFSEIDKHNYAIKPMNCPGSILVFKSRPRSYKELPLRLNEFGKVHRHELSGVLHGLFRTRAFTIDDCHIYCTLDQIENEILNAINIVKEVLKKFGFDSIHIGLSTKPENAMGHDSTWTTSINALKNALERADLKYVIQDGEGAFYGPKIEFKITDSMQRQWQCGTIQLDFCMPENFNLSYISSDGTQQKPVIIHQAIYGSLERFFAILLEHFKGILPFWLAPISIAILPVTNSQLEYANSIAKELKEHGVRLTVSDGTESLSSQIKDAQLEKIPWMLVIGKKEQEANKITLRYFNGTQEQNLSISDLLEKIKKEIS